MDQDPLKKEDDLRNMLDEDHIDIPQFTMKPKRWGRFINMLASPAKNPLESFISTTSGLMAIKVVPILAAVAISFI